MARSPPRPESRRTTWRRSRLSGQRHRPHPALAAGYVIFLEDAARNILTVIHPHSPKKVERHIDSLRLLLLTLDRLTYLQVIQGATFSDHLRTSLRHLVHFTLVEVRRG
jgi:hypothetical protein